MTKEETCVRFSIVFQELCRIINGTLDFFPVLLAPDLCRHVHSHPRRPHHPRYLFWHIYSINVRWRRNGQTSTRTSQGCMARRPRLHTPQLQAALHTPRARSCPIPPLFPRRPIRRPPCNPRIHRPKPAAHPIPTHATSVAVLYRETATGIASGGAGTPEDGTEARAGSRGAVQGCRWDSFEPGACRRAADAAGTAQPGYAANVQA